MEELKPCPFCGGKAEITEPQLQEKYSEKDKRLYLMKIICENCKAQIPVCFIVSDFSIDYFENECSHTTKMLIESWNKRTNKVKPRKVNKNEHC